VLICPCCLFGTFKACATKASSDSTIEHHSPQPHRHSSICHWQPTSGVRMSSTTQQRSPVPSLLTAPPPPPPTVVSAAASGRRTSAPLSSIPSNIQAEDLPMLDSAMTGDTSKPSRGTAAAAVGGRRSGRRTAAAGGGGGGGGPEDSGVDKPDADDAHGETHTRTGLLGSWCFCPWAALGAEIPGHVDDTKCVTCIECISVYSIASDAVTGAAHPRRSFTLLPVNRPSLGLEHPPCVMVVPSPRAAWQVHSCIPFHLSSEFTCCHC
jgi:hypothetical protein